MRTLPPLLLSMCVLTAFACGRAQVGDRDRVGVDRDAAAPRPPQDKIFVDFRKNWRELISQSPDFTRPVVVPEQPPAQAWQPRVLSECVFSADAGGMVPQVTLVWVEPTAQAPEGALSATRQAQTGTPRLRFDLTVQYQGFQRNFYSTALASDKLQRFKIPSTSALVADEPAVLVTGPALFPKLMDFRMDPITDRDTARPFLRHTLVLRDLNQGLSYTIRMDVPGSNAWNQDRQFAFLTPVCPTSF